MFATLASPRERIMARLDLTRFDIQMDPTAFKDLVAQRFVLHYPAIGTVDELLVRPREAARYCDHVRDALAATEEAAYDLPDDVILRTLLNARKRP